ncbi:MAG: NYN domain-containing protein, partial [Dorea sp.]
ERTLQVLDYAILVINGADGVQGHTRTLWNLLKQYEIPTFLFVNKMDQNGVEKEKNLEVLQKRLSEGCISFDELSSHPQGTEELWEMISMCDENAMEEYLETGTISKDTLIQIIAERKIFPCYFGSALKMQGVEEFLKGLETFTESRYGKEKKAQPFGAKVYKITRDSQGNRLTHLKITSGTLKVKALLKNESADWEEKVNQIRIYSGEKYEMVSEVEAGQICAVTGLSQTFSGEGLGVEEESGAPMLEPVLNYQIQFPKEIDAHTMLRNLRLLEEEDPMLRIVWNEELAEIHAQLMGEVQIEILKSLVKERFDIAIEFGAGNIVYKETIGKVAEGVGHFEPLRHYAEVHLILEPGKRGSGLVFDSDCSEDVLDKNWQRLILTHLYEKVHRGVLTGSAITDMKITLVAGRAHLKHTEGGDFRQSTYRAVRQGLMQAESILLEPYYEFRLEVPQEMVGRALTDIQRMYGEFQPPETEDDMAVVTGSAPVACMRDYQMEVNTYTKGRGRLACIFKGYDVCHNAEEVIEASGYDPERDLDNPTGSVFCAHGAGFNVPWNEVPEHMHIESQLKKRMIQEETRNEQTGGKATGVRFVGKEAAHTPVWNAKEEKELEEIFIRTYGKVERKLPDSNRTIGGTSKKQHQKKPEKVQEFLLVDGYNIIFAWQDLKELAKINIESARNKLMDILCNYQGFKKCTVILVFDAYKVDGYAQEIMKYHNIYVVYTKEAETADQYIEKVVHSIGRKYHVRVATSDGVERVVTLGQGGTLISAQEFEEEVEIVRHQIMEEAESRREKGKNYLFNHMDKELAQTMEEVRLGRKEL